MHLLLLLLLAVFQGLRCLYPPDGGRGAVEVVAEDLARLDPDEFLNDTIIDYYIK
jgi:sentrin-specific protease 7